MATVSENIFQHTLDLLLEPVRVHLDDDSVSEILINGPREVFIERSGKLVKTPEYFVVTEQLDAAVKNIAQYVGRHISADNPRLDARLPDGSRVHVVIPPAARLGPYIAIRKFFKQKLNLQKLIEFGALTPEASQFLGSCVLLFKNMMIAGGTGTGKTSLLNVLASLAPAEERICVIEDSSEIQLQQPHVVSLETQQGDVKGRGKVTIRHLFHSAMRLRPDRVIIGEIRGEEALDVIQAMTSGHSGSLSTVHASSPDDTLRRLETLAMMSEVEMPLFALRAQVASALQLIVQANRFPDGSRKITQISEVLPLDEQGQYRTMDIYRFQYEGVDANGRVKGGLRYTGHLPRWTEEAVQRELKLPPEMMAQYEIGRRAK